MKLFVLLALAAAGCVLLCGCPTGPHPHWPPDWLDGGNLRNVQLMDRADKDTQEFDEEAVLEGAKDNMFFAIRSQNELDMLKKRFGLKDLFATKSIDFEREIVVGAIGERAAVKRNFRIHRAIRTPQNFEVQVISFKRGKLEKEITPYVFVRFPLGDWRDIPVRFFLNDSEVQRDTLLQGKANNPLPSGRNQQVLTRDSVYHVYVPGKRNNPAPLVVLLHGSTTNGLAYIEKFEEQAEEAGIVIVALTNRNGYYWTEQHDYGAIYDCIDAVKARVSIDEANVFLAGSSAGGHTSYPFGLKNRHIFKGICAFCGRLNPAVEDSVVVNAKDMPICIIVGEKDDMVPEKAILAGRERLEKAGAKITYHLVKDAGHNLTRDPAIVKLMFDWLKVQIAAPDSRPKPTDK